MAAFDPSTCTLIGMCNPLLDISAVVPASMLEKYNVVEPLAKPESGVYGLVEGFGWTNAVFVDFARRLGKLTGR